MTTFTCPASGGGTSKVCVTQSPDFNDDLYMSSEWRRHKILLVPPPLGGHVKVVIKICVTHIGGTSKISVTQSTDFNDDHYMSSEWRRHK
jgi:hypothetical protein